MKTKFAKKNFVGSTLFIIQAGLFRYPCVQIETNE